jgi:hypothetical protein
VILGFVISTNAIFYSLIGLVIAYPVVGWHGWPLAFRLLTSRSVIVREYRSADLAPSEILTEATVARAAVPWLAFLFVLPRGIPLYPKCIFDPHHEIEITDARGTVRKIIICFGCDFLMTRSSESTKDGPLHGLGIRARTLKYWMQAHGIPVRPEIYVWSRGTSATT